MNITLKPIGSGDQIENDHGDAFTWFLVCEVVSEAGDHAPTDEEISEAVRHFYPGERCQHSYDCCGQFYPSSATWSHVKKWDDTTMEILIRQEYAANI